MDEIKIVIETEQGFSMTYYFSCEELCSFKSLIENKGNAVIAGKALSAQDDYLIHYKGKNFRGAYYGMLLEDVLQMLDEKIEQNCHK